MDPVTQGVFGSLWAQSAARSSRLRQAAIAGIAGGLAPDLDVLIRSREDSLLVIEYHRHFTHSLAFIPIGALAVALVLWPLFRRRAEFAWLYLWAFLGYASHGLLDAFTSYGTYLWWPFSDQRVAWNWISVIDPLFTVPLIGLLGAALIWRRRLLVGLAWCWAVGYLALAGVQNHRAESVLLDWADDHGLKVERHVAKPSFANLVLWRGMVDDGQTFHLVAIRNPPFGRQRLYPGGSVERFLVDGFDPETRLGSDLARFDHFSSNWLFRYPPYDSNGEWFVGDFRYAIDPASQRPLWGVVFDPKRTELPAEYTTPRRVTDEEREAFFQRLKGKQAGS